MANWYYYSKTGEKIGPISATSLKELARQGLITKETKVENDNGRTAIAGQINGLTFAETKQTEPATYGFDGGFDNGPDFPGFAGFPDLTSEGNTSANYDPFANAAPATHQMPIPSESSSTFTKPILLVPISVGLGMLLMLPLVFLIGGKRDNIPNENRAHVSQPKTTVPINPPQNNNVQVPQTKTISLNHAKAISLKEPSSKDYQDAFKQKMEEDCKKHFAWMNETGKEYLGDKAVNWTYSDDNIFPHVSTVKSSCDVSDLVYSILNKYQNENELLARMEALKNCYSLCMGNIASQWNSAIRVRAQYWQYNADYALVYTTNAYKNTHCYENMEQMMSSIKESVKTLDKEKHANTIKLYSMLSKFEKAATTPSGSLNAYSENMAAYQEEFTQTMSLAELEW